MAVQSAADAGFYSLVHEVLQAEKDRGGENRRGEDRRTFDCVQLIAPYREGRLPDAAEFRQVRCQDLSPGGFSYLDRDPPEHHQVIVALGRAPFIFVTAKVAHHVPVLRGERTEYLIGCRFTGKLEAPEEQ